MTAGLEPHILYALQSESQLTLPGDSDGEFNSGLYATLIHHPRLHQGISFISLPVQEFASVCIAVALSNLQPSLHCRNPFILY